jgi:hypothetical protein
LGCGDNDRACGDGETDDTNETIGAKQTIQTGAYGVGNFTTRAESNRLSGAANRD